RQPVTGFRAFKIDGQNVIAPAGEHDDGSARVASLRGVDGHRRLRDFADIDPRPAGHVLLATIGAYNRPGLLGSLDGPRVRDHARPYRHLLMARRWLPGGLRNAGTCQRQQQRESHSRPRVTSHQASSSICSSKARALPTGVQPWIAEAVVEGDRLPRQATHGRRRDRHTLSQLQIRHLVLASRLAAWLDSEQALSTPKAEQNAVILRADQQDRSVRRVHEMTPFHRLFQGPRSTNRGAKTLHKLGTPTGQGLDIRLRACSRRHLLHGAPTLLGERRTSVVRRCKFCSLAPAKNWAISS